MTYEHIVAETFISWPNRFIAHVETGNRTMVCHVRNTGRCREFLIPGVTVILEFHPDAALSGRKTEYDLIGMYKNGLLINIDSQVPNKVTWEWLISSGGGQYTEKNRYSLGSYVPFGIRREVTHGDSRFDLTFSLRNRDTRVVSPAFMEVKGVTLERNGLALFPDAPAKRGIKHLEGLIRAHEEGHEVYVLFVTQMKGILGFTPNDITHPASGETLRQAREAGVHVLAYGCLVNPDTMTVDSPVKVMLDQNVSQYTLQTLRAGASFAEAPAGLEFMLHITPLSRR